MFFSHHKEMPPKSATNPQTFPTKLVDKVVALLDLNKLASTLADSLSQKLLGSLDVDRLTNLVMSKYGEELEEKLISAIIDHL